MSYSNTTGWNGFDHAYVPRPISRGKTSLAEATTLSQQHVANTPPPPPPPPPAPTPTSPTIQRLPMPTRSGPVAVASPQIALAPVRSTPSPAPPPPPESTGPVEIALAPAVRLDLRDGRAIVADDGEGALRWAIVAPTDQVLRRFPAGSKVTEGSSHDLTVHYPGGSYRAGQRKPEKSKGKGHRHQPTGSVPIQRPEPASLRVESRGPRSTCW